MAPPHLIHRLVHEWPHSLYLRLLAGAAPAIPSGVPRRVGEGETHFWLPIQYFWGSHLGYASVKLE